MSAERPGDNGSMPTDRYDFERLEASVGQLLEDHERVRAEREAFLAELVDREHRIAQLEARLEAESKLRTAAVESVDRILERLEGLEAGVLEANAGQSR